jgi:phosphonate transport system substrate-binding protein
MNRAERQLLLVFWLTVILLLWARGAPAGSHADTISLGVVSAKPNHKIESHSAFVNYLARKLSSAATAKGNVVVAPTAQQLTKLLHEQKIDFYIESPYPTFVINKGAGARMLLRRWKGGVSDYRGILFTAKGSGITSVQNLPGRLIAFEDPGSTSAYFLPKVFLLQKGFTLTEKPSFDAAVAPREIGYLFAAGSEKKLWNWVLQGNVAAGALSNVDLEKRDAKARRDVMTLAETEMFPRHFLSVRRDLDPAVANRLKEILLSMHLDSEGQQVLRNYDNTTKFDSLPGGEEMMRRKFRELFG